MPSEVFDIDSFLSLSERARECRVVRQGDLVKLKLRTPSRLYTLKISASQASEVLSKVKCPVVEMV
ncbi:MAG: hypothetical protein N3H31_02670 [Candidatus Nezhaarchaeota archaeon]|nr:hypothetical protein [Candidatus Nezhaarchaeota archaeon]